MSFEHKCLFFIAQDMAAVAVHTVLTALVDRTPVAVRMHYCLAGYKEPVHSPLRIEQVAGHRESAHSWLQIEPGTDHKEPGHMDWAAEQDIVAHTDWLVAAAEQDTDHMGMKAAAEQDTDHMDWAVEPGTGHKKWLVGRDRQVAHFDQMFEAAQNQPRRPAKMNPF
ncbi:hypothetical protein KSZ_72350 [Dictyobacter formicarum]|uniref:Uncharacterized protein n=1 Tax=Dictyobacter formicarum TaxID=2778368 RepID=A0ABQ3VUC4_9CHLR|nr:hypothetical protein KSZ_72350 [Dictyobacter formicarum]